MNRHCYHVITWFCAVSSVSCRLLNTSSLTTSSPPCHRDLTHLLLRRNIWRCLQHLSLPLRHCHLQSQKENGHTAALNHAWLLGRAQTRCGLISKRGALSTSSSFRLSLRSTIGMCAILLRLSRADFVKVKIICCRANVRWRQSSCRQAFNF